MRKAIWTNEMLDALVSLYPCTPNDEVAQKLGLSKSSVIRMAKIMGLSKTMKTSRVKRIVIIKENYRNSSYSDLAKLTGMSKTAVARLVKHLGLKRTKEEASSIRSIVRKEMTRRDRLRIRIGLPPLTRLIERN